ncbi:MAG TPA: hypothetical protein VFD92_06440 [Candidatus Binatia bacterium]|nr:hypothetical protein [Candidatus Binatia bacterium]
MVAPSDALSHVGESVVVEGHVDSVVCSPQACLLSFEPGFSGLVVAIPGDAVGAFPDPDATYESRRVRVRGTIGERGGRPRMEVRDPTAIELADGSGAPPPRPRPSPASVAGVEPARGGTSAGGSSGVGALAGQVQVHVDGDPPRRPTLSADDAARKLGIELNELSREQAASNEAPVGASSELQLVREQLAAIASRLANLEARLDEIDQRVAAVEEIAAAGADAGQVAPAPRFAVPGRDAPPLHRVQSGWTAERVVRVIGEPLEVAGQPPGPFTWYYGGGRAITIDQHGRVASFVGF